MPFNGQKQIFYLQYQYRHTHKFAKKEQKIRQLETEKKEAFNPVFISFADLIAIYKNNLHLCIIIVCLSSIIIFSFHSVVELTLQIYFCSEYLSPKRFVSSFEKSLWTRASDEIRKQLYNNDFSTHFVIPNREKDMSSAYEQENYWKEN